MFRAKWMGLKKKKGGGGHRKKPAPVHKRLELEVKVQQCAKATLKWIKTKNLNALA